MHHLNSHRTLALLVVLIVGIVGGASATAAIMRSGTPVREVLAQSTNPQGGDGRTLYLQRVTIPGNTPLAAHTHAGTQIAAITTGVLRYTVLKGKPVKVLRPNALGTKPDVIRTIKAGETYDVKAGYSVIEPAGTAHQVEVIGATAVVIYVASLLTTGEPVSTPYIDIDMS
ncbi:MAG: cupin domain-containing protein [Thermoleophilia bacterium]|nr:cupin domain-containing protein [Thermoleophilia bacterium]